MVQGLKMYTWRCPICHERQSNLTTIERATMERQAENVLLSHIRTTRGNGHGREGALPDDFDPNEAIQHIEFRNEVEDPTSDLAP